MLCVDRRPDDLPLVGVGLVIVFGLKSDAFSFRLCDSITGVRNLSCELCQLGFCSVETRLGLQWQILAGVGFLTSPFRTTVRAERFTL